MKFRIRYQRYGHLYGYNYAKTLKSAFKKCAANGWKDDSDPTCVKPHTAIVEQGFGVGNNTRWEIVATVTPDGIEVADLQKRRSYQFAKQKISEARAQLAELEDVHQFFLNQAQVPA